MDLMKDSVLLGYVIKAFGVRGGVSIKLLNSDSEGIDIGTKITARLKDQTVRTLTVSDAMDGGRYFFEEIIDRTAAEALKGVEIWIDRALLPPIAEDEYYLSDLLGAEVIDVDGDLIGTIIGFSSNNAQTLFDIRLVAGGLASIPAIRPIIHKIDYENKIVTIDPPVGLLDLLE